MKTVMKIAGGFALCLSSFIVNSQTPVTTGKTDTTITGTKTQTGWDYKKNPTVDSISAKYRDKVVTNPAAMTMDQVFPVIGKYQSTTNTEAPVITISLDDQNKGIAWIDGLPLGRVKAMLRKSPATYKIPVQKTEEGKDVREGTLVFDKDLNRLQIILGKEYNEADPLSVFNTIVSTTPAPEKDAVIVKKKTGKTKIKVQPVEKPWLYTATKIQSVENSMGMK